MVQFLSINFFLGFFQFLLAFSEVPVFLCHSVYGLNGRCTNIRHSTESRQVTLEEYCKQSNELPRYIQGLICLSKKLLLHCNYTFTRAGKFTKRNINLFMSDVCRTMHRDIFL